MQGQRRKARLVPTRYVAATQLSVVGAGHARDEAATTLQSRCQNVAGAARSYGVIDH